MSRNHSGGLCSVGEINWFIKVTGNHISYQSNEFNLPHGPGEVARIHNPIGHAVLVMLQKPNKPDLSSPRSYRPIALLSVLGKGLERPLARRNAWIAIKEKILASQQFGVLPGRSAVDHTTFLTHDVERALNEGRTASMLTLDDKGSFDAVLPGRLVRRMREQGWPEYLAKLAVSFATNRTVQIRLDGETGPP